MDTKIIIGFLVVGIIVLLVSGQALRQSSGLALWQSLPADQAGSGQAFAAVSLHSAGSAILQKLHTQEVSCSTLANEDFELLGKYFLNQMTGDSHETINLAMQQQLGASEEKAMHIAIGQRFSGCNTTAILPISIIQMMSTDSYVQPTGWHDRSMMGGFGIMYGWSWAHWLWVITWYAAAIALVALGVRWLRKSHLISHRSSMEILKERYASGGLDKEHFEEMKKELLK